MNTELKNAVKATDSKAQYDASAKRLLGHERWGVTDYRKRRSTKG